MVHLVYCDNKTKELDKIINNEKTMIIRAAAGKKIPHRRVFTDETLYFIEKGTKAINYSATVTNVYNYVKLTDEEITKVVNDNNTKLNLTDEQKNRWHKKCICLVEFKDVRKIDSLIFDHQSNMDDWLILDKIE